MKSLADRFWAKVDKSGGPDACWPWLAAVNGAGYGIIRLRGKNIRAHRVAWELASGQLNDRVHVLHRCDNPPCVNTAHLFTGTHGDNMADMAAKGRHLEKYKTLPSGDNHWARRLPEKVRRGASHHFRLSPMLAAKGEQAARSKLTDELVRRCRIEFLAGSATTRMLADRYGVTFQGMDAILKRKTWRHI